MLTGCIIYFSYDENAALLRRNMKPNIRVPLALRLKLNRALAQIIRNKKLEGNVAMETEQDKLESNEEKISQKKSQAFGLSNTQKSHGLVE